MERVLVTACSFEERSLVGPREFLSRGGNCENVLLADIGEPYERYRENLELLRGWGITNVETVDRFSSASLWGWARTVVQQACARTSRLVIDITCLPREVLGMVLFAVSVRRMVWTSVEIVYVAAPEGGYASQNTALKEDERWLSKGVAAVRSIVGYPGMFRGDRTCHLVVLAGHETDRVLEIVEYVEPKRLTISPERVGSSTVEGARDLSKVVVEDLRDRIQVPDIGSLEFSSSSIEQVLETLSEAELGRGVENVALVAMNTKVSFVGAALFGLVERKVRMLYAVPDFYNPLYCDGVGKKYLFDITESIRAAKTEVVKCEEL